MASTTTPKTRQGLSLSERIKVIEARQMGKSMRQLAAQFNCGKTQILNTLAQKERYLSEWHLLGGCNNPSMGARKRFRHTRNEQINSSVNEWYHQQKTLGLRITGPMLQRQARTFAAQLGISNFAASNGWLANFRRFYNILAARSWSVKSKIFDSQVSVEEQQASTSRFEDSELLNPIVYEEANRSSSPMQSNTAKSQETDPLEETTRHLIYLPASPNEHNEHHKMSHLLPSVIQRTSTAALQMSFQQSANSRGKRIQPNGSPSASVSTSNHPRKRRLLQVAGSPPPLISAESGCESDNPNIRGIQSHLPKDYFSEFVTLARSKGLITILMKDDRGNDWLEVRQFIAGHRVPKHNYPTHLSRLLVNADVHYFLEVLGHCVRQGSLVKDPGNPGLDHSKASALLRALNGGFTVCAGVERSLLTTDKSVQEICYSENLHLTVPDNRYRSTDCSKWIDNRIGPRCSACLLKKTIKEEYSVSPMDLRCTSAHQQYEH